MIFFFYQSERFSQVVIKYIQLSGFCLQAAGIHCLLEVASLIYHLSSSVHVLSACILNERYNDQTCYRSTCRAAADHEMCITPLYSHLFYMFILHWSEAVSVLCPALRWIFDQSYCIHVHGCCAVDHQLHGKWKNIQYFQILVILCWMYIRYLHVEFVCGSTACRTVRIGVWYQCLPASVAEHTACLGSAEYHEIGNSSITQGNKSQGVFSKLLLVSSELCVL